MFDINFDEIQKLGPVLGFLGTIIGLIFTGLQVKKNTQIQRARFLLDLTSRDLDKDGAWDLFFKIERGEFKIANMAEFDQDKDSVALDALLYHFEIVGRLFRMGAITLAEVDFYKYEMKTVFADPQVQEYLKSSDALALRNHTKTLYPDARHVARKL